MFICQVFGLQICFWAQDTLSASHRDQSWFKLTHLIVYCCQRRRGCQCSWSLGVWSQILFFNWSVESRNHLENVSADTTSPGFPREGPKQVGGPGFFPGGREGAAAAGQTGAAGAAKDAMMAQTRRQPAGALLCWKIFWEEAAIVCGAGCTAGAWRAEVVKHADLVTVVGHHAPVAADAGKSVATVAYGRIRKQRGV